MVLAVVSEDGADGDFEGEGGAETGAGGFNFDGSAVEFHELLGDGESETEAAEATAGGGVGLTEAVEDVGEEFGFDAAAGVDDLNFGGGGTAAEDDVDRTALGGELDGVGEEVPDDLLDAVGIAGDFTGGGVEVGDDFYLFCVGGGLDDFDGGGDDFDELAGEDFEAEFSGDDAGDVEDVFDELGLGFGAAVDGFDAFVEIGIGVGFAFEEAGPSDDGVEGGAHFVGEGGEEEILGAVGGLCFHACGLFVGEEGFAARVRGVCGRRCRGRCTG